MGEGVVGAREFLFPDSSSGQRSFWPILVEIWWVWFLGDTIPVDLGTTLPKTHFQEQARKRELRPPKQEAGTSMSRILMYPCYIQIHRTAVALENQRKEMYLVCCLMHAEMME